MSPRPDARAGSPRSRARLRVLVVDDEPAICRMLALLLARCDVDAVTAQSGAEALARLAEQEMDGLVLDLRLRDEAEAGDGDELYRRIVQRYPALRTRTLFMTGDISAAAERAIAATGCPYLRKPFDSSVAVQTILARSGVPPAATRVSTLGSRGSAGGMSQRA